MRKLLSILSVVVLTTTTSINAITCGCEKNNIVNNFYVLGDSLSDVGALTGAGSQFFQNIPFQKHDVELKPPYYQNRSWCNGPVVTELVSEKLKQKSIAGWDFLALNLSRHSRVGNNYAFGGALACKIPLSVEGLFLNKFSLSSQLTSLLKQHNNFTKNDLVFINIGSNDLMKIIDNNISDIDNAIENIILEIKSNLKKLIDIKCQHIIITNIADMGLIPNYKATSKQSKMTNCVNKYNEKLQEEISELNKKYTNIVKEYDTFSKFNNLLASFTNRGSQYQNSNATTIDINTLGTTGILQPQYVTGANPQNIDNYFFIDQFHPTKWVQEQSANDLYEFILENKL
ncbi:SGNH/GDSL hydrolase family protein [Spiroplasma ixodetis]|uniref:SGNH/GDSL hydrolase family protein n=1 Tax=Spiroplasma ixodetis TaxID=2141 RepID=UPI0025765388|nr:SGNH/GDSL hydrolase family protein [Spiroplasma ixodetis]WJG71474.1 lipolytic enzyme, GDSL family [Spiroplasma ixodetis Y32]